MSESPKLALIVGRAHDNVIGFEGDMPWHLPEDLAHFKRTTMGKPVIMGRKTWDSLPKPLPGRPNLVVSRQRGLILNGALCFTSLEDAVDAASELAREAGVSEFMLIGGAELYALGLPLADKLYITEIDLNVAGDTFFPEFQAADWRLASSEPLAVAEGRPDAVVNTWCRQR